MKTAKSLFVILSVAMAFALTNVSANQPRMEEALGSLRAARAALEHAEHNKGGHRERAIAAIDQAIAEVRAGMADAR